MGGFKTLQKKMHVLIVLVFSSMIVPLLSSSPDTSSLEMEAHREEFDEMDTDKSETLDAVRNFEYSPVNIYIQNTCTYSTERNIYIHIK